MIDNLLEIFDARSSVRSFVDQEVELDKIKELCVCAMRAPTACNLQQWRFTIVTDQELKKKIVDAGGSRLILDAPSGILVSYARDTKNILYHDDIQSAAAAIEHILLAAPQLGLGACWVCNLPTKGEMRRIFKMHRRFSPVAYVLIGYPKSLRRHMPCRRKVDEVIAINHFPLLEEDEKTSYIKSVVGRFFVLIYRFSPTIIKSLFLNKLIDSRFTKKFD